MMQRDTCLPCEVPSIESHFNSPASFLPKHPRGDGHATLIGDPMESLVPGFCRHMESETVDQRLLSLMLYVILLSKETNKCLKIN